MGNPVLQLSCETKQIGGWTIRHENCNTNYTVSSSINEIFWKIRCHKGGNVIYKTIFIAGWKDMTEQSNLERIGHIGPHHHPHEHTTEEIADMRKRNSNAGLVVFWVKLRQRGYTRSVTGLYRLLRWQWQMGVKLPNSKYIARPYEQMQYPGQRVQKEKSFINTPPLTNTPDFAI